MRQNVRTNLYPLILDVVAKEFIKRGTSTELSPEKRAKTVYDW